MKYLKNNEIDRLILLLLFKNDKNLQTRLRFKPEYYENNGKLKKVFYLFNNEKVIVISANLWSWCLKNNLFSRRWEKC